MPFPTLRNCIDGVQATSYQELLIFDPEKGIQRYYHEKLNRKMKVILYFAVTLNVHFAIRYKYQRCDKVNQSVDIPTCASTNLVPPIPPKNPPKYQVVPENKKPLLHTGLLAQKSFGEITSDHC